MMTIGDALAEKLRDVVVTETAIRTHLRIAKPGSRAIEIINGYIDENNQAYHVEPRDAGNGTRTVRSKNYTSTWFTSADSAFVDYSKTSVTTGDISVKLNLAGSDLDLQLDVQRKMGAATPPTVSTPGLLRTLANDPRVALREAGNDDHIVDHPIDLYRGNAWLRERIFSSTRTLAIIAIGYPVLLDDATIEALARRVCGLAHVVVFRDNDISFDISDTFGKQWSVYHSAIRVYGPNLHPQDDSRRGSRIAFAERFSGDNRLKGLSLTLDDLVISAGRYVQTQLLDRPMPSREAAIERARRIRAAHITATPHPQTAPPLSELEPTETNVPTIEEAQLEQATSDDQYRERLAELQAEVDAFRTSNSLLTEEYDYQRQLAESWEQTARERQLTIENLQSFAETATTLAHLTPAWRETVGQLLVNAAAASENERRNDELEEIVATMRTQQTLLEHRLGSQDATAAIAPPQPQNPESLITYLGLTYPGAFAILGQGSRSYKKTDPYQDQDRFLEALDVLGREYYAWKTAAGDDILERKRAFDDRCTALSLKNTLSATPQGYAVNPEEHSVRMTGNRKRQMYELRDVGTTMEQRHMLYLGYAWDDEAGQIVIARFDHPVVMSAKT